MKNQFDAVKFAITVKVWRNMNGFTLRDMCELCGMEIPTVKFVENGDRTPTMDEFSHLCDLMGIEAACFFKTAGMDKNGTSN